MINYNCLSQPILLETKMTNAFSPSYGLIVILKYREKKNFPENLSTKLIYHFRGMTLAYH